ncbi:MAG: hypothetical protein PHD32_01960 [Eubacteriales bacterium]|nr:hypothetical protein [Eubacteriales bacterium]
MKQTQKAYSFDKNMMLNVIYDTLERLGVSVGSSNSEYGRIQFRANGADFDLRIITVYPQETVRVMISWDENHSDSDLAEVLFDEMNSTISIIEAKQAML